MRIDPTEVEEKLRIIRVALAAHALQAIRLRGTDWFAWATGGASNTVLLTSEVGVAELLITASEVIVLTDVIEAERLAIEEFAGSSPEIWAGPWGDRAQLEAFVLKRTRGGPVGSDRPSAGERPLPLEVIAAKRRLLPQEVERYIALGKDAAEAMTATLEQARPDWTEFELAACGSRSLWARGIHPALTLVGGEERVARFRHPVATEQPLGRRAMLVFCARRHGLYANLTRFVAFRKETDREKALMMDVAEIEAAAWEQTRPAATIGSVYHAMDEAYQRLNHADGIRWHHQGGSTGYLSREKVAVADDQTCIDAQTAFAWNPSLPAAKIEDTVLCTSDGIKVLTYDTRWPTMLVAGQLRPITLELT